MRCYRLLFGLHQLSLRIQCALGTLAPWYATWSWDVVASMPLTLRVISAVSAVYCSPESTCSTTLSDSKLMCSEVSERQEHDEDCQQRRG
ncbi:hypothetical protein CPB84DRAFT_1792942 [Gymnopilus junonius]|uniref:Uncharacterized protein n=1 Tax=Gymnopilus junonius TaxID=109634 RepID=A0A9P5ND99_GYMJU|nr:hypothetical protein CPB84DRAFT_1792942 [Gymnopilus junonius]